MKLSGASPQPTGPFELPPEAQGRQVSEYFAEIGLGNQTVYWVEAENTVAEFPGECAFAIVDGVGIGGDNRRGRKFGDDKIKGYGHGLSTYARTGTTDPHDFSLWENQRSKIVTPEGLTQEDTAYHLSGDEFAVILRGISSLQDVFTWKKRIQLKLRLIGLDTYIGIALHNGTETAAELTHRADILMQAEKRERKLQKLSTEGKEFMRKFGSEAIRLGIEPSDIPTLIEMLVTNESNDQSG